MQFTKVSLEQRLQLYEILIENGPSKISDTLERLMSMGYEEEYSKHIIRQSIDRGETKTDAHFRLNADKLPEDRSPK